MQQQLRYLANNLSKEGNDVKVLTEQSVDLFNGDERSAKAEMLRQNQMWVGCSEEMNEIHRKLFLYIPDFCFSRDRISSNCCKKSLIRNPNPVSSNFIDAYLLSGLQSCDSLCRSLLRFHVNRIP